jgi:outer membrane lipoprotein-sorting protein
MKLPRQARWAVPGGAVAAVGLVIAGSVIAGAQTTPRLPARTTTQLLAAVSNQAAVAQPMTAVVQESASLGLPDLPSSSDPLSPLSLLSGTHTFKIWYGGPAMVRVAVPVQLGETDLRVDGSSAWLWNSQTDQATHYLLPAPAERATFGAPPQASPVGSIPTPQQLSRQILAAVGPTTTVGLQQNVTVAGQAAYQLSLAPKDSRSLIGRVQIAVDAKTSLPLRVQVFARGASGPALSVAYTSLSYGAPAASNFSFSPPAGAKVKTVRVPGSPLPGIPGSPLPGIPAVPSSPNVQVFVPAPDNGGLVPAPGSKPVPAAEARKIEAAFANSLPASLSKARRAALLKQFAGQLTGKGMLVTPPPSAVPRSGMSISSSSVGSISASSSAVSYGFSASPVTAAPKVMGKGWLSVAVLPEGFTSHGGFMPKGAATAVPSGPANLLGALTAAATPVHGSWGSGRLLRTSLVSVLMTDKGDVLVGAVVPSVLYSDAAQLG